MSPASTQMVAWLAGLLLQSVWIAALTATLSWLVRRRLRDPRALHAVAAGALLLIAVGLVAIGVGTWPRLEPAAPAISAPPVSAVVGVPMAIAASSSVVAAPAAPLAPDWRAWLVLAWACGVLALAFRHAAGWWHALRMRATATRLTGELADLLALRCRGAGIRAPLLLVTTRIAVPAAIGWWRPTILFPAGLLTGLPPAQLDALLLHELAHLRRHDWLIEMGVSLIEGLLFFHPAVWWLGRQLRHARELCCDGQAVRDGAGPDCLARALCALAERTVPDSPALAASGGMLADRVRRLLGLPARPERPWRALAALTLLPLLLALVVACAQVVATAPQREPPPTTTLASKPETTSAFPLARRIRAHADGRQVQIMARTFTAPVAFWSELGLAGEQPQVLDRAQAACVLAAATTDARATSIDAPSLTTFGLQRASPTFLRQFAYIADYTLVNEAPDPVISVLSYGSVLNVCVEPVPEGVLLLEADTAQGELLGVESCAFLWPAQGVARSYRLELPVVLNKIGRLPAETRLRAGEAVVIPSLAQIQRAQPEFRYALEHGTITKRIADPDLAARPRTICLITAEAVGQPGIQLDATPAADTWLDGTRVSLTCKDAPLDEALRSLAAQLPVPLEVARDADYAATRVSLDARNEPVRAVLTRLLSQSLLDATASLGLLRLQAYPSSDYPVTKLGGSQPANSNAPPSLIFETLPGPAWAAPLSRRYDLSDLLLADQLPELQRNGWSITPGDQAHLLFTDTTAAAVLSRSICTSTWSSVERSIVPDGDGLAVSAAPAVHVAIADELWRRRSTHPIQARIDLVRLDAATWKELGLESMASGAASGGLDDSGLDDSLAQRVLAAAALLGPRPPTLAVTIGSGELIDAQPEAASWWSGYAISVQPVLSRDQSFLTWTVASRHPQGIYSRTSRRVPIDQSGLIQGLGNGIAVLVRTGVVK